MSSIWNGVYIFLYTEVDQAIHSWMDSFAKTPVWIDDNGDTHPATTIKKVFATPQRAFGMMRKILRMDIDTHETPIPLPFYSIMRLDPIPEPDRDMVTLGNIRAWDYKQIKCTVCDTIIPLASFNTGTCPHCGASIDEDTNSEFLSYDLESKTVDEANSDEWHYEGSSWVPEPYMVQYQFDLWCKTLAEANYQQMLFMREFTKGDLILNIDYPNPMGTQKTYVDNLDITNNSDLEPGENNVNIRFSITCDVHTWLPPLIDRTGPVKTLNIEYHNDTDGTIFHVDYDIFNS